MFVATFWLNGGLNQITFRERVLRFALPCSFRRSRYSVSALNPLSRSALSYNGLASAKTSLLLEMSVKRRPDRGWKIPDDIRRVVRLVMDVQRLVVGLAKRVKAFG